MSASQVAQQAAAAAATPPPTFYNTSVLDVESTNVNSLVTYTWSGTTAANTAILSNNNISYTFGFGSSITSSLTPPRFNPRGLYATFVDLPRNRLITGSATATYTSTGGNMGANLPSVTIPTPVNMYAVTLAGLSSTTNTTIVDGQGSSARIRQPQGIVLDNNSVGGVPAPNAYFTDFNGRCIRKLRPDGMVITIAGINNTSGSVDGIGTAASFGNLKGIAISPDYQKLYVADMGNNKIRMIDLTTFQVTTVAGGGGMALIILEALALIIY